ncbi:hypothetical protein F1559_001758 [Cyanidiococcus yangmingshanensis]|uniref:Elongation factor P n=1 Tax=Cyanidiococcus yangmingshanensis TaxID=2690220 RepID=A0A7J7IJD2_9RHOD|nr:hypothetical protein F1559_001758 [Cyanidiococcus yangmingshanensis]
MQPAPGFVNAYTFRVGSVQPTDARRSLACRARLGVCPTAKTRGTVLRPAPGRTSALDAWRRQSHRAYQHRRHSLRMDISSNDFRVGLTIEVDGSPFKVIEHLHVKPGKGAAFVRTKLKNLLTGNSMERTFRAGESVPEAQVEKVEMQYTYAEESDYVFMNMTTFEEERIPASTVGDTAKYLRTGQDVSVTKWNGKPIEVEVPTTMTLEVVETDPGVRGNTAQGGSKPAKLETGVVIQVPLFINVGEKVKVDTRTGTYLSRG